MSGGKNRRDEIRNALRQTPQGVFIRLGKRTALAVQQLITLKNCVGDDADSHHEAVDIQMLIGLVDTTVAFGEVRLAFHGFGGSSQ